MKCSQPSSFMGFAWFSQNMYPGIMPGKPDLPYDLHAFRIQSLFRVSSPNPHPPCDLHGFHRTCIQGSCQGDLIYHGICMLLASNLYSGSVLPTLTSPMGFHRMYIQGSCQGNLIYHMICMLLASNLYSGSDLQHALQ